MHSKGQWCCALPLDGIGRCTRGPSSQKTLVVLCRCNNCSPSSTSHILQPGQLLWLLGGTWRMGVLVVLRTQRVLSEPWFSHLRKENPCPFPLPACVPLMERARVTSSARLPLQLTPSAAPLRKGAESSHLQVMSVKVNVIGSGQCPQLLRARLVTVSKALSIPGLGSQWLGEPGPSWGLLAASSQSMGAGCPSCAGCFLSALGSREKSGCSVSPTALQEGRACFLPPGGAWA